MALAETPTAHGHVQIIGGRGARRWRAFWWDADGKHSRVLGPAWIKNSGNQTPRGAIVWHAADGPRPAPEYLTPKDVQAELRRILEHEAATSAAHRKTSGELMTFADAAEAWLADGSKRRNLKLSSWKDYRQALDAYLLPRDAANEERITAYGRAPFGGMPLKKIRLSTLTNWSDELPHGRTAEKLVTMVGAILGYAHAEGWIADDPSEKLRRAPVRYSGDYDFYSREEIQQLADAAITSQDRAVFLTAAMTGLRRGELMALRWRDVDFAGDSIHVRANYSFGELVTPKSGKVRTVPMVPDVAKALANLKNRELLKQKDDPVFLSANGGHMDGAVLRRRYAGAVKRAGLRHLPFHSLRHYFGSTAVKRASLVQVQAWMGHSHIQTTARYLHAKSQANDAVLLAQAFAA